MYKFFLPIALLAMVIVSASCSGSGSGTGDDDMAAIVNGTKITVKDVDTSISEQAPGAENQMSQIELAGARLQALNRLIDQEVLFQRAQKEGIAPTDEEIKNFIQRTKQERGMTEETFNNYLKQINQTEDQLKEQVKKQISINKLIEKSQSQLKVKDSEVQDFYKADPKAFTQHPGVGLSDIVVDPANNGLKIDAVGDEAAKVRADEIYARLKSGSDFATIARQQSEHETFQKSGDLGFLAQSQFKDLPQVMGLPATVGDELMAMKEGDVTAPKMDSQKRWHILKVTGKITESRDRGLDDPEVKQAISDSILQQRITIVRAALQASARDEAKIENYLAQKMLQNPNNFGVLRPAPGKSSASK